LKIILKKYYKNEFLDKDIVTYILLRPNL